MARTPRFEGSPEDERRDKAAAARAGVSRRDFEKSAADKAMDRAGQARFDRGERGFRRGGKVAAFGGKKAPPFGARKGRK